jgi:hypothetical protein
VSGDVFAWQFAVVHASMGAADEAFVALETALEERSDVLVYLRSDPHWDPIRQDGRFAGLLQRIGLA